MSSSSCRPSCCCTPAASTSPVALVRTGGGCGGVDGKMRFWVGGVQGCSRTWPVFTSRAPHALVPLACPPDFLSSFLRQESPELQHCPTHFSLSRSLLLSPSHTYTHLNWRLVGKLFRQDVLGLALFYAENVFLACIIKYLPLYVCLVNIKPDCWWCCSICNLTSSS